MSMRSFQTPILAAALCATLLLAGCAEQRIRDASRSALVAGDYEQSVRKLEAGLKEHPESSLLRSGLIQARSEAVAHLLTQFEARRGAGKLDDAQALLERAQSVDPQNRRVEALLAELAIERRQQAALAEAEGLVGKGRPEQALRVAAQALKDNARHAGLQALHRRLEAEQRLAQLKSSQAVLGEARPISLDFRDANLRTVLDVVSRNSGINFILDKDIRPDVRVTVFLRQARVEDALDLIVGTNQLGKKVVDAQTIVIYPNTPEKQREYQEQVVRVFYIASAEAKGAAAFLKAMLKIREPFVDERSNMLALRESPENIQLAERLIALYDAGEPEVLLDVEVLEVSSTRLTELGVTLPNSFSLALLPPAGSTSLNLGNVEGITRNRIGLTVGNAVVHLRREVGDFTTLANPKIRARSKEKAKILIGDKIPVISATTGQAGFVADTVSYLDVGLKLDVEPTVYADDEVAIKIALEVSTLGTAVKTQSGTLAYQIGTRNASTLLRLRDNETQLLAGLISRDERTNATRLPGIGDLPVLGRLFSNQLDNGQRTELVLAITPRILRNIRRPDASETELWVGTESLPKLRPVGGLRSVGAPAGDAAAPAATAPAVPGVSGVSGVSGAALPGAPAATTLPEQAAAPAHLRYKWIAPSEVKAGETVEVQLIQDSSAPLRGASLDLGFSADKLRLLEVVEGEYFKQDGAVTSFSRSGDGKDATVRAGILRNQATAVAGQGTLLRLRFKALAAGAAEVRVAAVRPMALTPSPAAPSALPVLSLQVR